MLGGWGGFGGGVEVGMWVCEGDIVEMGMKGGRGQIANYSPK